MADEEEILPCVWCGSPMPYERCEACDHVRGMPPWPYVVLGPGASGDFNDLQDANEALILHPNQAAIYVRLDRLGPHLYDRARMILPERQAEQFGRMLRQIEQRAVKPGFDHRPASWQATAERPCRCGCHRSRDYPTTPSRPCWLCGHVQSEGTLTEDGWIA